MKICSEYPEQKMRFSTCFLSCFQLFFFYRYLCLCYTRWYE